MKAAKGLAVLSLVRLRKQRLLSFFVIPLMLVLTACSTGGENPTKDPGVTTLIYAQLSENGVDREWLDRFNSEHEGEIQIEVRDYSQTSEYGEQGIDLLMTEIAAGKVPDIIELGTSGETTELSYDAFFGRGGRATFIGYPTEDGSVGSSFGISGRTLAMSSACQNKEAAWEFLRQVLLPQYRDMDDMIDNHSFFLTPVNRTDYDMMIECVMTKDVLGELRSGELPTLKIHRSTQEEVDRFEDLFNSIETINLYDPTVYDIANEACGPYFAGDKTIDETVTLIQNRVSLYLNELQ